MAKRKALTVAQVVKALEAEPQDYEVAAKVGGGDISGEVYQVDVADLEKAVYLYCRDLS